ncbi:MAG TPA: helix-turn-helix transcriptional regulator, partial [Tichowtungia sp.]|nr:helix-turn-helix transcriptional regulator [Tichowtungia sp.]
DVMKKKPQLLPRHLRQFEALGENLKLARLRRNLTAEMVAQRAGISRMTLNKIENGNPSVAMGNYFMVLHVLGLSDDFGQLADKDDFGHDLMDNQLFSKNRASKLKLTL